MSKPTYTKNIEEDIFYIESEVSVPIWLTITEAAKIGGVNNKTIRRAIQDDKINFKIIKNKYFVNTKSLLNFLHTKTKLKNKLNFFGFGQYVEKWRK